MKAEIITIGDEILIGQIVDSNSAFIGAELNKIGVSVYQITSVQDERQHILNALQEAADRVDIVVVTGGLGPTKDDITKTTFCEFFDDVLVENKAVLAQVVALFEKVYQKPITSLNKTQALLPSKATILNNAFGTAAGMWMMQKETIFVSLPGVPYEMKALMTNHVLPKLQKEFTLPSIVHKTLLTHGIGESGIAERIEVFEDNLPSFVKLAYLPSTGRVRLRLSGRHADKAYLTKSIDALTIQLKSHVEDIFVGFEDEGTIEQAIGALLSNSGKTLATAESCTGGAIAQRITRNAGVSSFFKGTIVSYATTTKIDLLDVSEDLIAQHSVVSEPVAEAMALGAKNKLKSDYAIATTGNAGPTKGDSDVKVGTVCIAIATPETTITETFYFGENRERLINKTINTVFELLQKEILKN